MTGGKGLVGIIDEPGGNLGIRARVRNDVSAKKIQECHCFCYFPQIRYRLIKFKANILKYSKQNSNIVFIVIILLK